MLTDYIAAAMKYATIEWWDDDQVWYGEIPPCQGVWAQADTAVVCRQELREVLEDWILVGLRPGHDLPVIDGIRLTPDVAATA